MERVTNIISINAEEGDITVFDVPRVYPFKVVHFGLPTDNTGYVYCLVSKRDHGEIYIGTAKNITQRQDDHKTHTAAALEVQQIHV